MLNISCLRLNQTIAASGLMMALLVGGVGADDTEIYKSDNITTGARPNVLIVFDDSGSMDTIIKGQPPAYSPTGVYDSKHGSKRVYWTTGGNLPESGSDNYFMASSNRCAESYAALNSVGYFQTKALRWKAAYKNGGWKSLYYKDQTPVHVECSADVINENNSNGAGVGNGYPKNTKDNGDEYDAVTANDSKVSWDEKPYTFYTSHYMDYYYDESLIGEDQMRIEIAQEVVTSLVTANAAIDFGLAVFNDNGSSHNGGRIVQRIIDDMTITDRTNLIAIVNSFEPKGSTPLCETTYEAYRYLAGLTVKYGDDRDTTDDPIPRDTGAESPIGTYASPAKDCNTYIILMTDGAPTSDSNANDDIEDLTGEKCDIYDGSKNCLPALAEYMATHDLDDDTTNGDQYGFTYTIGFATEQTLLEATADKGNGEYFTAETADELATAFKAAILSILSSESTYTSPAVAVDTFTRTESRDEVYYAMFKPDDQVDWPGNIKKLKLALKSDVLTLVDANGDPAIDPVSGNIKETATTFWGTVKDGPDVLAGGVGGLLAVRDPATRSLRTNTGVAGALEAFDSTTMVAAAFGFSSDDELFELFEVADQDELNVLLRWAAGYDVDDEDGDGDTDDAQSWVLGDILHSQPLVINYGARGSFSKSAPDLRLVVGTNAGFLHMFGDDNGQEDWAIFPKELAPMLAERYQNSISAEAVYGVDLAPVSFIKDLNFDGTIDSTVGDKAYVYVGLRRGGEALYAFDLSNPEAPAFLWLINDNTPGFGELGQTWSRPLLTRIPGYVDDSGVSKPVLVFAAGYDVNKDITGVGTPDSVGRGLYIVDAVTGALVWSVTPAANSATNLQEIGLLHSVPASVTVLDSNGDELSDRFNFADTGGNIWRVDLPGISLPTATQNTWRITKLASFNGATVATDRRFFNKPDLVRLRYNDKSVDALLIASGDRTNPNATDVENRFYMIRDEQVGIYATPAPSVADCSGPTPVDDFRCELPLTDTDLYDITPDLLASGTALEQATAQAELDSANGWRLDLALPGEKGLADSLTIGGKVQLPTFSPTSTAAISCKPEAGEGRLYFIDLYTGARVYLALGDVIPETPSLYFGKDGVISLLLPPGAPAGSAGDLINGSGIIELNAGIRAPYGNYWFQEEY